MLRFLLPLCLAPLPALACVTAQDATQGVTFTRADGHVGRLVVTGDEVRIDYDTGREAATDDRKATHGVFETMRIVQTSPEPILGSGIPVQSWTFAPKPVPVEAGGGWSGRLKGQSDHVVYGAEMVEEHSYTRWKSTATFAFLPEQEVEISGCPYVVIPVEATYAGEERQGQRWLYFKDLGFAIETIRDGKKNGIRSLKAE